MTVPSDNTRPTGPLRRAKPESLISFSPHVDKFALIDPKSPPKRIGPVEFGELGRLVTVQCPRELDHVMRRAGGQWDPGGKRWLIELSRIGPVIRTLRRVADPLFRAAGISLE